MRKLKKNKTVNAMQLKSSHSLNRLKNPVTAESTLYELMYILLLLGDKCCAKILFDILLFLFISKEAYGKTTFSTRCVTYTYFKSLTDVWCNSLPVA